jgi:ribose 5-phosphate isomerase B
VAASCDRNALRVMLRGGVSGGLRLWRAPSHAIKGLQRLRIAIASDHAAVALKSSLASWLSEQGHDVFDLGADGTASVDYPDYGFALAAAIGDGRAERGIALCGSGVGIAIAANRHSACRCALVSEPLSAALARQHNDANAIAMGARLIGEDMAKACIAAFLTTEFAGGRHQRRVDKLSTSFSSVDTLSAKEFAA